MRDLEAQLGSKLAPSGVDDAPVSRMDAAAPRALVLIRACERCKGSQSDTTTWPCSFHALKTLERTGICFGYDIRVKPGTDEERDQI